jgi:hypothetical protein
MITLHILKLLEDSGFGTIGTDLHWETLPIGKDGVFIISRGGETHRNFRATQSFDLYSRGANSLKSADKLEKIWEFISEDVVVCDLPITAESHKEYKRVRFIPEANMENLGEDEAGRKIWRWSYQVNYIKEKANG